MASTVQSCGIGRCAADAAIPGACGKPHFAGLRRAIPKDSDGWTGAPESPRHHSAHHAAPEWRNGVAASAASRHSSAALKKEHLRHWNTKGAMKIAPFYFEPELICLN